MSNYHYPPFDGLISIRVPVSAAATEFHFAQERSLDDKVVVGLAVNTRARIEPGADAAPLIGTTAATAANNTWLYLVTLDQKTPIEALAWNTLDAYQTGVAGVFPVPELRIDWKRSKIVNRKAATDFAAGEVAVLTVYYRDANKAKTKGR